MATTTAFFCAHKRLRTSCPECSTKMQLPSALVDEDDLTLRESPAPR